MKRVLVTGDGYTSEQLGLLTSAGWDITRHGEISTDVLRAAIPEVSAYVLGGNERLDAELLASAQKLEVISFVGTGYGAFIDEEAAARYRIRIVNTPGVMARSVAEHTVGMLVGLVRSLFSGNESIKRGLPAPGPSRELYGMDVGILGMGCIGSLVARTLRASFGSKVRYASRSRKCQLEVELNLEKVELQDLFRASDAVILLAETNVETRKCVNTKVLSQARQGLYLVNTASPELVEPNALRFALEEGPVEAAAFDGYWIEPLPSPTSDPYGLLRLPDRKFFVTPHTAAKARGVWERMLGIAIENLIQPDGDAHVISGGRCE